jgi:pimeloyl-ACP methyl ester carboxylesterase
MTSRPRSAVQQRIRGPGRPGRQRIATAAVVITATLAPPFGAAAPAVPVPVIAWQPCAAPLPQGFDCASAVVPMDYAQPTGATFRLALIRHQAQDPGSRIGTLFWNPGGPSDAGTAYLPIAIDGFPEQVRRRFDIVSWDPRGMGGGTTPVVQCFDSAQAERDFLAKTFGDLTSIPVSSPELAQSINARTRLNQRCVRRDGRLMAHVSTADNARDLDLLRAAVGEEKISYYGTSYGTFLGATYINMFPQRVRAAVLDGAVSPRAWAGNDRDARTLTTFLRIGSDHGAADTVKAFMRECGRVGAAGCAFADRSPAATRDKWNKLLARLAARPVTLDGQSVDARSLLAYVQGALDTTRPVPGFERFPGYVAVAQFVQRVWTAAQGRSGASTQPPARPRHPQRPRPRAPTPRAWAGRPPWSVGRAPTPRRRRGTRTRPGRPTGAPDPTSGHSRPCAAAGRSHRPTATWDPGPPRPCRSS